MIVHSRIIDVAFQHCKRAHINNVPTGGTQGVQEPGITDLGITESGITESGITEGNRKRV